MSHDHGHGDKPFLAHHFEDEDHQFDSGKLGIWVFLVTEVLFFSGLFCAYAIYRAMHPEIFVFASKALDTKWGAINTCVLLFSSLTAAWAVRNAQLNQKKGLILNLTLTILCAFAFMGIKYVEYSHKFHVGLKPGTMYAPTEGAYPEKGHGQAKARTVALAQAEDVHAPAAPATPETPVVEQVAGPDEHGHEMVPWDDPRVPAETKNRLKIFFGIYFCMTGLHGIHVLGGIVVIAWLIRRAVRGDFHSQNYGAVDFVGLYWHLVDLIWIYLFPLLYLIH
jgi:cytochrome c oxidase subunit 3